MVDDQAPITFDMLKQRIFSECDEWAVWLPFCKYCFHKYSSVLWQHLWQPKWRDPLLIHLEKVTCQCSRSVTCFQRSVCPCQMPGLDGGETGKNGSLSSVGMGVARVWKVKAAG